MLNPVTFGEKNKKMFEVDVSTVSISMTFLKDSGYFKYEASSNTVYNKNEVNLTGAYKTKVKFYQYTTRGPASIKSFNLYNNVNPEFTLDLSCLVDCRVYSATGKQISSIVFPTTDVSVTIQLRQNKLQYLDLTMLTGLTNVDLYGNPLVDVKFPRSYGKVSSFVVSDTSLTSLDISSMYGLGGNVEVRFNKFLQSLTMPESSNYFTNFHLEETSVNFLDLSRLNGLGGIISFIANRKLSTVLFPKSDVSITNFNMYNTASNRKNDIIGTIDLSGLVGLGGSILMAPCPSLNMVIFPSTVDHSPPITTLNLANCDISGTLDLSGLKKLGGFVDLQNNPKMSMVVNPSSNEPISRYNFYANYAFKGELDLRPLKGLGGNINIYAMPGLETLLFPDSSQRVTTLYAYGIRARSIDISGMTGINCTNVNLTQNPSLGVAIIGNASINTLSISYSSHQSNKITMLDLSGVKQLTTLDTQNSYIRDIKFPLDPSTTPVTLSMNNTRLECSTLDVSMFPNIGYLAISTNPSINKVILPTNSSSYQTQIFMSSCSLIGEVDLTGFDSVYRVYVDSNPSVNSIKIPKGNLPYIYDLNLSYCDYGPTIDISNLKNFYNEIYIRNNKNLTTIVHPESSLLYRNILGYYVNTNNLTGTLDLTCMKPFVARTMQFNNNPNLENIVFHPDSSGYVNYFYASKTAIQTLDISMFPLGGLTTSNQGAFQVYDCSYLQKILLMDSDYHVAAFHVYNSSLNGVLEVPIKYLYGDLQFYRNRNLTGIKFKSSSDNTYQVQRFRVNDCSLSGTLDISMFRGFGTTSTTDYSGEFDFSNNRNLTNILFPTSPNHLRNLYINNCNLTGEVDLSGLYGLGMNIPQGMYFHAYGNPNLTSLKLPTSPYSISIFNCASCNLTGVLDVSGLTGLGVTHGNFIVNYNRNLTNVLFPDCSGAFNTIYMNDCSLNGTLDLSKLRRLGYNLNNGMNLGLNANRGLTSILFPNSSTGSLNIFDASGCNITGRLDINTPIFYNSSRINLMGNPNLTDVSMVGPSDVNTYEFNAKDCSLTKDGIDRILSFFSNSTNALSMVMYLDGGTSAEPSGGYNNVFLKNIISRKGSNFRYFINYNVEPMLKFPILYASGVSMNITSTDGSMFEVDAGNGLGLSRVNGTYSPGYNSNPYMQYFNIYDGSTLGKDYLKVLSASQLNVLSLDVSSFNRIETLHLANSTPVLDTIFLPNPSSLTSLSLGIRDISILDLRNYTNLQYVNLTGGVKDVWFGESSTALSVNLSNCSRLTSVDMSSLIGISNIYIVYCQLNDIKFPNQFYRTVHNVAITDTSLQTIDVSNLTLSGSLQVFNNPNLTSIICPSTSVFTIQLFNNNLQGVLDLTSLSTSSTELQAYNNRSLTSILMPKGSLYGILAYDCSLNGVLDISSNTPFFSNPSGVNINLTNNTSLTSVLFPVFSNYPRRILLQNCALDIATMDTLLKRLSTYFSSNSVTQDLSIYLNGGTNSSPTDGEYNMDLSILKWKFQTASKVLDYKIN